MTSTHYLEKTTHDVDGEINIEEFSSDSVYCPPAQRTLQEILNSDRNDESLQRYKKSLLHDVSIDSTVVENSSNTARVIINSISLVIDNKVRSSISPPFDNVEITWSMKAGEQYKIQLDFYVQNDIISGLKYLHKVTRLGLPAKESYMLGSYAPRKESYCYLSPYEEAPSGMLSRGKYRVQSLITDDDRNNWLQWTWNIIIVKNS